jgi:hypothetical protein
MKDPSPKSRLATITETNPKLSAISPVRMAPPPSNESNDLKDYNHEPIQQLGSTEESRVSEAIQVPNTEVIGHVNSQGSTSANERLHNAIKTVANARTVSTMSIAQVVTIADEDHLNSNSAIAIHADFSFEHVSPPLDDYQRDRHLKELSVNLPSKTDYNQREGGIAKEPYQSIFGQQTTAEELESPEMVTPSPSVSLQGKVGDVPNGAALDACEENEESDGAISSVRRSAGRKPKETTYAAPRSASSSKKRKGDVLPQPMDEDSDTIQVVPRSTKSTKSRSSRESKVSLGSLTRNSRKVVANGLPGASKRSRMASDDLPPSPDSTPSVSKSRRASSFKSHQGPAPKVLFSGSCTVDGKNNIMESFRSFGGSVTKSIRKADVLCVSSGALKKTTNFVTAVALGKYVVDERWLVESHRKHTLLDPEAFIPQDTEHEREWDFNLKAAIARGKSGLSDLLDATSVYFTRQLEIDLGTNFKDFHRIAEILGADDRGVDLPTETSTGERIVIIGVEDDPQAPIVRGLGLKLHQKDLLVMGALRGQVDLESDDFVIEAPIKSETDA